MKHWSLTDLIRNIGEGILHDAGSASDAHDSYAAQSVVTPKDGETGSGGRGIVLDVFVKLR